MLRLVTALFLFVCLALSASAQTTIAPGESHTVSEVVTCTACAACPAPPEPVACDSCSEEEPVVEAPNTKIVDQSGNGDYLTPRDAVAASQPGWTILVKTGTYNRAVTFLTSGTVAEPIVMKPYPGHTPVFDFTNSPDNYPRIQIQAEYITVEGFEVKNGWDGIKIVAGGHNATIRDNYVHDNDFMGVVVVNGNNNVIENNEIARNGISGKCMINGVDSPRHCHGIYFSNWQCAGGNIGNLVQNNNIHDHPGSAVQFNGLMAGVCSTHMTGNVIRNNRFENNSSGMNIYYGLFDNEISGNTFIMNSYPETNEKYPAFLRIYGSADNVITNNTFENTVDNFYNLQVWDKKSARNNVDNNSWTTVEKYWVWKINWRNDFPDYQSVSGWDANGTVNE